MTYDINLSLSWEYLSVFSAIYSLRGESATEKETLRIPPPIFKNSVKPVKQVVALTRSGITDYEAGRKKAKERKLMAFQK